MSPDREELRQCRNPTDTLQLSSKIQDLTLCHSEEIYLMQCDRQAYLDIIVILCAEEYVDMFKTDVLKDSKFTVVPGLQRLHSSTDLNTYTLASGWYMI